MPKSNIKTVKKVVSRKEFEAVVTGHTSKTTYFLHRIVSLIRRLSRGDKIEDFEFGALHQDIDIFFVKFSLPLSVKKLKK